MRSRMREGIGLYVNKHDHREQHSFDDGYFHTFIRWLNDPMH